MKGTPQYYGTLSRFFHWLMAAMFAFMLCTAAMWNINEKYYSLMGYHKSVGFLLLVLVALRLVWALANWRNRPHGSLAVKLGHAALYVLMAAVPVVAMIRQYGSARGDLEVFGITVMHKIEQPIEWMTQLGNAAHGKLAYLLFVLAFGHIAMAVLHQLRGEKIINRMAGKPAVGDE